MEDRDQRKGEKKSHLDIAKLQNPKESATRGKRQTIYKKTMSLTADMAATTVEPKDS